MRIFYVFKLAFINVLTKKVRSILTVSGIGLSIGVFIVMIGIGYGMQAIITDQMTQSESLNVVTVTTTKPQDIKLDDAAIGKIKALSGVDKVEEVYNLSGKLAYNGINASTPIYAVTPGYFDINNMPFASGQKITAENTGDKPIVINKNILKAFSIKSPQDAIDKKISIELVLTKDNSTAQKEQVKKYTAGDFKIVGVIDKEDSPVVFIPSTTAKDLGADKASQLKALASYPDKITTIRSSIEQLGFKTASVRDALDQVNRIFNTIRVITVIVGLITLLVAIFGTLNTITITLVEQFREIGFLRIMGIRKSDVRLLFVSESMILSIGGMILGIILGLLIGGIINLMIHRMVSASIADKVVLFQTPTFMIILLVGSSILLGWLIGLYPSRKAVKIDPLDALKFE